MSKGATIIDQCDDIASRLPEADQLPDAFIALKRQLQEQTELVNKKSEVIQNQQARISVLEEQLRSNKVERYAASSEVNPLQARLFNEAEALGESESDSEEDESAPATGEEGSAKSPGKSRPKRKGLNPDISRVQHRLLLTDEQREGAIDTFFVTVKEELDITPAQVQVIEILQEKAVYLDDSGQRKVIAAEREPHPLGSLYNVWILFASLNVAGATEGFCQKILFRVELQR